MPINSHSRAAAAMLPPVIGLFSSRIGFGSVNAEDDGCRDASPTRVSGAPSATRGVRSVSSGSGRRLSPEPGPCSPDSETLKNALPLRFLASDCHFHTSDVSGAFPHADLVHDFRDGLDPVARSRVMAASLILRAWTYSRALRHRRLRRVRRHVHHWCTGSCRVGRFFGDSRGGHRHSAGNC